MSEPIPATNTLSFDVEGMTCAACARRVEKALGKVEGVREARVDLVRERASFELVGPSERVRSDAESAVERAGYRLVPRDPTQASVRGRTRDVRAWIAFALTIAAFFAALGGYPRIELALACGAVLGAGAPIFLKAWREARDRALGMDVLIALGATAALASAGLALALDSGHAHGAMQHSDATMAALIVAVALLGKRVERAAKARATDAIEALVRALPDAARVVRHGLEAEIPIDEVREGDEVRIAPFARVPVDGELLAEEGAEGPASLDESVVTGESRPVDRRAGERVLGGAVNLGRPIRIRASSGGRGSELAKVIEAVTRASAGKTAIVRVTDRIASIFVPVVLSVAAITLAGWLASGAAFADALRIAIAVLVVACPCALGLATPVAVTVAVGHLASLGVLVRDADVLERLPRVRTLVLDKTGTLTVGAPRVLAVVIADDAGATEDELLALAASVESESHHPLARALFEEAMRRALTVPRATEIEELAGSGVRGRVTDRVIEVGRADAAADPRFATPSGVEAASIVEVRVEGRSVARVFLEDALRPEAREVIDALRARGLAVVIRSGDAPAAVARVASALAIDDAIGGQRPEEKLEGLARLAPPIAMIGDGINDAPALARADVGFSLGARTETTLRAAGVALPRPDLRLVLDAHELTRRLSRVVRQNLAMAFAYNVLAIPFAAVGAFERIGGAGAAAVAMAASSLLVVLNALRLRGRSGVVSRA